MPGPVLDDNGEPVKQVLDDNGEPLDQPTMLSKAWHFVSDPITNAPSRWGKSIEDYISDPNRQIIKPTGQGGIHDYLAEREAMGKGFIGGAMHGLGDVASSLTSPMNLSAAALTMGGSLAESSGMEGLAAGLKTAEKIPAGLMMAHGGAAALSPDSTLMERGQGALEAALGGATMMHSGMPNATAEAAKPTMIMKNEIPDLYHGTTRQFDQFEPGKGGGFANYNKWTSFTENPEYAKLYSEGKYGTMKREMPKDAGVPRVIKASVDAENILDLTKPLDDTARTNISNAYSTMFKGKVPDLTDDTFAKSLVPQLYDKLPYDAIKFEEHGQSNWAISPKAQINIDKGTAPAPTDAMQKLKIGTKIIIQNDKETPLRVKAARAAGFELDDVRDDGSFRFIKTKDVGPPQPILEQEVGHARNPNPKEVVKEPGVIEKTLNSARAGMSTADMSAPLRQGLPLIHKSEFWNALPDMVRAFKSPEAFDAIQSEIANRPLFKKRIGPNDTILPSFAEERGLKLTGLHDLKPREEAFAKNYLEELPKALGGGVVRGSERAYTAFLNKLRADTFENLVKDTKVFGADTTKNIPLANAMAEFVNNATGRGSLKFGKLDMEDSAQTLSHFLFSPRLMASRLQFANPKNLIFAPKQVRMEYYKSLITMGAVGNTLGQLAKMSGYGNVESNPASSDYGKIKIGDVRIDPYGGFQQYIVAAKRLIPHFIDTDKPETNTGIVPVDNFIHLLGDPSGMMKSTTSGKEYSLDDPRYGQSNKLDVLMRFAQGKAAPIPSFIMGLLRNKTEMSGQKMNLTTMNPMDNSIAQRFMPMVAQDLWDLYSHDAPMPAKVAAAIAAWFGAGVQTYGAQDFGNARMRQAE